MCGIYCVYKQSKSCQLPFCASPIFHFEIGDFSVYVNYNITSAMLSILSGRSDTTEGSYSLYTQICVFKKAACSGA